MASSSSASCTHNFKIDLDKSLIPLLIGRGGKNLFIKVIKASIDEFKTLKEPTHQEKIDMVKNGDIMIKNLRIEIKHNDDVAEPFTYATWSDVKVLEQANILLIHIIKKKITECAESVNKYVETKDMHKSKKPEARKYKQVFNFRMNLGKDSEDVQIGQFIGNGGETINEFKKKIAKEMNVEKVYINIDDFDNDTFMYRVIGNVISAEDDLMFKISYIGGNRDDILKVEKMLIDFVNENCDNDSDSDSDNDKDSDNDSDSDND